MSACPGLNEVASSNDSNTPQFIINSIGSNLQTNPEMTSNVGLLDVSVFFPKAFFEAYQMLPE